MVNLTENKETLLDLINRLGPDEELADSIEISMNEMRGYNDDKK